MMIQVLFFVHFHSPPSSRFGLIPVDGEKNARDFLADAILELACLTRPAEWTNKFTLTKLSFKIRHLDLR